VAKVSPDLLALLGLFDDRAGHRKVPGPDLFVKPWSWTFRSFVGRVRPWDLDHHAWWQRRITGKKQAKDRLSRRLVGKEGRGGKRFPQMVGLTLF